MNKHLHRIIFNAARGMRMVVQETACSTGKGASRATCSPGGARRSAAAAGLFCLMAVSTGQAQIASGPGVPGPLRPNVLVAPNGVPLVNIQTPSAAGVSRNVYDQFDVMRNGAILNNSRSNVQTQLGGFVQGNPWLARGPARVILNEINSGRPTQLRGFVEVGGQRAEVVIANPAGISVDGGGFVNASRATLTTGVPQFNAAGGLDSFVVRGGTVGIDGAGLDAGQTDHAAILARAVQVNAGIWANELKVIAGGNQVSADHDSVTPVAGAGLALSFALDVAALGGMYARKITLIGTEAGLGVRNAGGVGAGAGGLVVTARGRLENSGTLEGPRVELTSAADIDNRGGTIRQTSMAGLTLDSVVLTNTNGGAIGAPASPPSTGQDSTGSATAALASSGASILSSTGEAMANAGASTASIQVPEAPGTVTAAGTIRNDGGRIQAGGAITLKTPQIDNAGGTLHVAAMAVSGANFSNAGGTLDVDRAFVAKVGRFDNAGGKLNAGSLDIAASGDLLNAGGTLASGGDANLAVGGRIDNAHGTVSATGRLIARASQEVNNSNGTLIANQGLTLDAGALNNTNGSIQSVNEQAQLDVVRRLNNTRGAIGAGTDLLVKAQALSTSGTVRAGNDMTMSVVDALVNDGDITAGRHAALAAGSLTSGRTGVIGAGVQADGTLGNAGDLRMTSTGVLIAHGTQLAAGTAMLQGASIELAVGQTRAAGIALTATQGNVSASEKAAVVTPGTLRVTADAQTAQALTNDGGMLHAGQLALNVSNLVNTNLGEIVHTGIDATRIAVSGTLKNDGGRIASNGQDLELNAAALGNAGGTLEHSGTGTLHIAGGSYSGEHGRIAGNGALLFDVAHSLTQDNGQIRAREINIEAGALSNRGGTISGKTLAIDTRGGALDNSAKGSMAAADALTLRTGALNNAAGLIQSGGALRIDTNGQVLTNTDAAGYKTRSEDFAGGIASGGSLTLKTGDLKNTAGAIGSQGALTADTQAFTNTGGGLVLGQAKVHVTARGAAYDNSGGQTLAAGDFVLDAGASKVANDGGLIRSNAAALLTAGSVVNTNTNSDTNTTTGQQGIEGRNVTVVSGAEVDNTAGRMLALETLAISDPNVADPAARTLVITNTGGVLMGGQPPAPGEDGKMRPGVGGVRLAAKSFSGDGRIVSASGLGIALVRDVTHDADLVVDGDLSYTTGGKFTNNAKLMAGQTLTVGAGSVENAANAEMSGRKTVVNAIATLVNRGLIDSQGATQVDAGDVKNIGTGRIYGNAVSLATGALDNREETVDGVTRAGTIAARETLNIGAGTVSNREHALIFSAGTGPKAMSIGGRLDENRQATTGGGVLDNLSARIESLGGMTISMAQINNLDTHVKLGAPVTTKEFSRTIGVEGIGHFKPEDVVFSAGKPNLSIRSPSGNWRPANGHVWGLWDTTTAVTTDVAIDADPAAIVAGRDMTLEGVGLNRDSRITAGDTLTAPGVKNEALQGQRATHKGSIVLWRASHREPDVNDPVSIVSVDVGAFEKTGNLNAIKGYDSGRAPHGASVGNQSNVIVEVPAAVGAVVKHRGQAADAVADLGNTAGTGTSQPMPMVVRTSAPRIGIPQASLFNLNGGPRGYLVETDPRFASYRKWLGSDYLLNGLGLDPNTTLKRLGDGFYEQKLVREQVAQLTGYRYLGGHSDDEAQYTALMNDGATFARQYGLRPGIALTAAQMAQLTSDIVWLVEQTVTLPDGSTQDVLAPQLYVRVRPGDIDGSGALLSAEATVIKGGGDLVNTGTIAGRTLVKIDKDNVNNLGGRIAGANVDIHARRDIDNIGGRITAEDSAVLKADRDLNIETTTRTQGGVLASRTNIDRVAGVYVSNQEGTLVANAGKNVNLIGGVLASNGTGSFTSVKAGKSINVGSVTESSSLLSIASPTNMHGHAYSTEVGSTIVGEGTVLLNAEGGDINVRASTIDAGAGVLGLAAAGDINIFSGDETRSTMDRRQTRKKHKLKSTTTAIASDEDSSASIGSRLSGGSVGVFADGDINVVGSDIEARKNAALKAKGRVNIVSSVDSASTSLDITRTTKGFIAPKLGGSSIDRQLRVEQHAALSSQTQRASSVTAGENLNITGDQQVNVFASHLRAGADLNVKGGKVTVLSGTNEVSTDSGTKTSKRSIGTMGNPKRSGKGMNGKSSVTDSVYESTLAPATLNGRNVSLTATDGDLTLGAAQIHTGEQLALSAPKGQVNMAIVKTARQASQSRGESDPMYQRTRETGAYAETANYTRIDSASLKLDTPKLNVEVGQNTVKGNGGATVAQQTLEQVLATQRGQPGMGWLSQVQSDPGLRELEINWQGVPLEQRRWAEKQGSLTEAGGAVVAIVAAVLSWGAASGLGAAAGSAVGGAAETVVSAAVAAGVSSIASQAAVSLINNNGDIAKVVKDLTSSRGIKGIVTAMATAGALQGLNIGLGIESYTAANVGRTVADGTTIGWAQVLQRNLINGVSGGLINSAIQGTSVEEGIKSGLLSGLLSTAAAGSAHWIGANGPDGTQNLNRFASEVAHGIAGCLVGAGRAAGGNGSMSGGSGCGAGALGAVVGHVTGRIYNPNADPQYAERTVQLGQMVAGIAGALVGGTQATADIASAAGANAIENNWLSGAQKRQRATELAACGKGDAALSCQFKTAERWIGVDADQQGVFDKLSVAKDLVAINPTLANVTALKNAIAGMVDLVGEFEAAGDKGAVRTLSAALVPAVLLRGQSCAALQGAAGCGSLALTPTERRVLGTAFGEFGVAADGTIGASNLRNMQVIGEAIASGGASTWTAIADTSRGLAATARQPVRPTSAVAAVVEETVQGAGTTLPRATDGTAGSAYSSAGMRYGNTTATDTAGNPLQTTPSLGAGGANWGVIRGFTPTESKIINEAQGILKSSELAKIQSAHAAGKPVTITISGRLIQYEPGLPASGMTMFGENGFLIGREAFASQTELKQTILHELYRLTTSNSANGISGALAAQETKAAADFAAKAVREIK